MKTCVRAKLRQFARKRDSSSSETRPDPVLIMLMRTRLPMAMLLVAHAACNAVRSPTKERMQCEEEVPLQGRLQTHRDGV